MVAIIDYGVGNLLAIQNIIKKAGGTSVVTKSPEVIAKSDKIVLPGVGSFGYGMEMLQRNQLVELLTYEVFEKKKIIFGLCLGAQLMTKFSEEGNVSGLGWISARTVKFDAALVSVSPHMGWADIDVSTPNHLYHDIVTPRFYFTHSYHFSFEDSEYVTGNAHYGYDFPCSFQKDNIFGVQFHPEKSHKFGLKLFENFLSL